MKSVKPSRGSSLEHGIAGLVAVVVGIVWLSQASKMGAPTSMLLFGGLFILIGVINAFLGFYNAQASNRLSSYDIVEDEPDIFEKTLGNDTPKEGSPNTAHIVEQKSMKITNFVPNVASNYDGNNKIMVFFYRWACIQAKI